MKLLYYLFFMGAVAFSNTQLIQTHQPVLQPAQGQAPAQPEPASFNSHLPDESNFQASGGATVGSFGGMARVFVMIAMFLGFLYTGVLLGGGEGSIRPPSVRSLHIPEMQEPMEPEVIPSVSFEKPSKQAAKKARRDAKRAQEAKEAKETEEAPAAAAVVEAAPAEEVVSALPESPVGPVRAAEKPHHQKKKKEKKQREEIPEEPLKIVEEQPKVEAQPLVVVEEAVVTVEETLPVEVEEPAKEVPQQTQDEEPLCFEEEIASVPLCLEEQVFEEEEDTMLGEEDVFVQELDERDFMLPSEEPVVEEGNFLATPKAQQDYVEDLLAFAMAEEALDRQAKELFGELPLREPVEEAENGWVKRSPKPFEPTSMTIKRARRLMGLHSLLKPSQHELELDLDLGSSVVDPFAARPVFPKLTMPTFMPEETHSLDLASQEAPTDIEPMRDKIVSPPPAVQESHPVQENGNFKPMTDNEPVGWSFNSHKKSAWTRRQNRTTQWPEVPLPELLCYGWSPIRTPCKFASACKKPGCQFTHPTNVPSSSWNNNQAVPSTA